MDEILDGPSQPEGPRKSAVRIWIRRAFLLWATFAMAWMVNSFRTKGVDPALLEHGNNIRVEDLSETLMFVPTTSGHENALLFFCGSGVSAHAYAPLLRPVAEAGHVVFIIKLPYRFALLETHREEALVRARRVMGRQYNIKSWVIAGHSLGGALAARLVQTDRAGISALVLIGTTHPKEDDLSNLDIPVTKIYASEDGVAPREKIHANKYLLPSHTQWVEIEGGNHAQFGHYGPQLLDGSPAVSREAQQEITRETLLNVLVPTTHMKE